MIAKTNAIVISTLKYGETSLIVKCYTEKFGVQSYIINGVRSKSRKNKISFFQPLTQLELVVYHKENSSLKRITEYKSLYTYQNIFIEHEKILVSFFLQEVLSKVLREEQANSSLFSFITTSFLIFDNLPSKSPNFHIQFLLKLLDFLGYSITKMSSFWEHIMILVPNQQLNIHLDNLLNSDYDTLIKISNPERRELLRYILKYYQLHYESFNHLTTLEILKEILD
ncbi:MAG: DNA repair protein RecO [Cytophagales bacterium]